MHTATCLLDTGAGVNLFCSSQKSDEWRNLMKREKLPTIRTTTKQLLQLDALILLRFQKGDLNTQIRLRMAPNLVANILDGTSFQECFIRGISSSERKFVSWLFQLLHKHRRNARCTDKPTILNLRVQPPTKTQQSVDGPQELVQVAHHIVLKPFTKYTVLVETSSHNFVTLELKQLSANYPLAAAANGVAHILRQRPFCIYMRKFPRKAACSHQHTVIAQTAERSSAIHVSHTRPRRGSQLGISNEDHQAHPILEKDATSGFPTTDNVSTPQ